MQGEKTAFRIANEATDKLISKKKKKKNKKLLKLNSTKIHDPIKNGPKN